MFLYSRIFLIFAPNKILIRNNFGHFAGTGTGDHVDPAHAANQAIAVEDEERLASGSTASTSGSSPVLAYWVLVDPVYGGLAHAYLYKPKDQGGLGHIGGETLTRDEMQKVFDFVKKEAGGKLGHAFIFEQCHGDIVFVAAGWWHAVLNVRRCIKYAVEFVKVDHFQVYAHMEREVRVLFGEANADSYISICDIVLEMFKWIRGL